MTRNAWVNLALGAAEGTGLINLLQRTNPGTGRDLYVLAYHRIEEPGGRSWLNPDNISTTPRDFEAQMRLVADRYHPVAANEVLEAARGGAPLPRDAVLVTVDDGYRDFLDTTFPVCSRYGIHPLLFVPTAYVGAGTFWWDKVYQIIFLSGQTEIETPIGRLGPMAEGDRFRALHQLIRALKQMPFDRVENWVETTHASAVHLPEEQNHNTLTWDELRRLSQQGVTVASHTHTHPILTQIPPAEAQQQIRLSQAILQRELGTAVPIFAFPDGKPQAYSSALIEMLYAEGFEILFLLVNGRAVIQPGTHRLTLPRLAVWRNQTLPQFHLRLTPFIDLQKTRA